MTAFNPLNVTNDSFFGVVILRNKNNIFLGEGEINLSKLHESQCGVKSVR